MPKVEYLPAQRATGIEAILPHHCKSQSPPAGRHGREAAFVWLVWAILAAFAIGVFLCFSTSIPFGDDWYLFAPIQSGHPIDAQFLWAQLSENRLPLTKLLCVAILKLSGGNIRGIILYNVLADIGLSAAFIHALRRTRGRSAWTDAFLPLIWLNPAHIPAFTWASIATMVTSNLLVAILLLVITINRDGLSAWGGLVGGVCLAALPWCGAHGILAAVVMSCWFLPLSFNRLKEAGARGSKFHMSYVHAALGIIAIGLIPFYFAGYRSMDGTPISPGLAPSALTTLEYFATGFAAGSRVAWIFASLVTVCLASICISFLHAKLRERTHEWPRVLGLAACIAAGLILALAVGMKRAGLGPGAGYAIRYAEYGSLFLTALYITSALYAPPRMSAVPAVFVALILLLFPVLMKNGLNIAVTARLNAQRFERDAENDADFAVLASRYATDLQIPVDIVQDLLPDLRRAGVMPFARIQPVPPTVEVPIPSAPSSLRNCAWENGAVRTTGRISGLIYNLPHRRFVTAVRLTYSHRNSLHALPAFEMYWKRSDQPEFAQREWPNRQHYFFPFLPTGEEQHTTVIYVNDAIDQFCICPDRVPCLFHISDVTLLVPGPSGSAERSPNRE